MRYQTQAADAELTATWTRGVACQSPPYHNGPNSSVYSHWPQRVWQCDLLMSHIWLYLGAMHRTWTNWTCSQSIRARPWLSLAVSRVCPQQASILGSVSLARALLASNSVHSALSPLCPRAAETHWAAPSPLLPGTMLAQATLVPSQWTTHCLTVVYCLVDYIKFDYFLI